MSLEQNEITSDGKTKKPEKYPNFGKQQNSKYSLREIRKSKQKLGNTLNLMKMKT